MERNKQTNRNKNTGLFIYIYRYISPNEDNTEQKERELIKKRMKIKAHFLNYYAHNLCELCNTRLLADTAFVNYVT